MNPTDLADCVFATWSPRIGDPTAMGWLTVVLYVSASGLAGLVYLSKTERAGAFWLILWLVLLALAVNKQLDIQSALTAVGRCVAMAQDWYDQRRTVQIRFILSIAAASVMAALFLGWAMRRTLARTWLALTGVVFLLGFIVIRAAGFHNFDRFIASEILSFRMNWLFEMGGIAMIAINALYLLARRPSARGPTALHR